MYTLYSFSDKKDHQMMEGSPCVSEVFSPVVKRVRTCSPPLSERVMLYVRQDAEDVYTPLHVVPPTTQGLLHAVSYTNRPIPILPNLLARSHSLPYEGFHHALGNITFG